MSLETTVRELALPAGRKPGTAGHRAAVDYLERRLAALGLKPYRGNSFALPYGRGHVNVVAERPGGNIL